MYYTNAQTWLGLKISEAIPCDMLIITESMGCGEMCTDLVGSYNEYSKGILVRALAITQKKLIFVPALNLP